MAKKPTGKKPRKRSKGLTGAQKVFVVQCLAEFMSPKEASEAVKERFGVDITPQGCEHYDPYKKIGSDLAKSLVEVFHQTRADFLKDTKKHVPIANKTVRMRILADELKKFQRSGNSMGVMRVLEQAAKEMGGSFTNQREVSGRDGKPIEVKHYESMSIDELKAELRANGYDPDAHRATPTLN